MYYPTSMLESSKEEAEVNSWDANRGADLLDGPDDCRERVGAVPREGRSSAHVVAHQPDSGSGRPLSRESGTFLKFSSRIWTWLQVQMFKTGAVFQTSRYGLLTISNSGAVQLDGCSGFHVVAHQPGCAVESLGLGCLGGGLGLRVLFFWTQDVC